MRTGDPARWLTVFARRSEGAFAEQTLTGKKLARDGRFRYRPRSIQQLNDRTIQRLNDCHVSTL
jgi:hypothetical protein